MIGRGWSLQVSHQSCKVIRCVCVWGGSCTWPGVPNYFFLWWYSPSIQNNTLHPLQNGQPEILKGYISGSLEFNSFQIGGFPRKGAPGQRHTQQLVSASD